MPALVTHHLFSASAVHSAKPYIASAAAADPMAFAWGAQGPDILFFYRPLMENSVSALGHAMHERQVRQTFHSLIRSCAALDTPSAMSYLLGFCCHYALDRTVHPYVTYVANYWLNPRYPYRSHEQLHCLCESEFDRIMIRKELGTDSASFRAYGLLSVQKNARDAASKLLSDAAWNCYGRRLSPHTISRAMHSTLAVQRVLHYASGRRSDTVVTMEKILHSSGAVSAHIRPTKPLPVDCTNKCHDAWIDASIPHIRRYESFFDLLSQAQRPAVMLMESCYDAVQHSGKLPSELFSLNYLGLAEPR